MKRFPLASAITAILWVGFAGSVHAQEQESAPEVAELGHFEVLPGNLERYPGLVVCAPHADHDRNTGTIVRTIHELSDVPAVLAWGFRRRSDDVWFDVNRPTTRVIESGELTDNRKITPLATAIYEEYQGHVQRTAGLGPDRPVALYVDIHGHNARYTKADGTEGRLQIVEAVATGFTDDEVRRVVDEYDRLVEVHGLENAAPMRFYQTEPFYEHDGVEVIFTWTASGARRIGTMREERARRSLHFENPSIMRGPDERLPLVAAVYSDLITYVWEEIIPPSEHGIVTVEPIAGASH